MYPSVYLVIGAVLVYYAVSGFNGLRSNIAAARRTGLPYVVVPCSPISIPWQLTSAIWTPLIKTLPKSWWERWLDIMQHDWSYRFLETPWQRLGDTFLMVTPGNIIMWTRNAEAIHQVTARREAFPKPTHKYEILAIFGRNILTTEGPEWKVHRKGVSASFNERNAAQIFGESVKQTQGMISKWLGGAMGEKEARGSGTITTLEHDTMTLALNIIAHVGFGLRFFWAGQKMPDDLSALNKKYASLEPPAGHSMTFADSLATVLEKITLLLLVPRWLLQVLPFKATKSALEAHSNYNKYMEEFLQDKIAAAQHDDANAEGGMDLMGQLVRAKYGGKNKKDEAQLSDSDILGDAFIIIVAGHETTANTLHFTLIELANNPAAQRALQADVDRLLGKDSDPLAWNYEQSINALTASNIAACMNETLRLTPPVVDIPKWVSPGHDQMIALDGEKHLLPKGMSIVLNTVGVHRNPRHWPARQTTTTEDQESDLNDFVPERWFRPSLSKASEGQQQDDEEAEEFGGFKGRDTSEQLYRPVRGSYLPFSDGARSCIGRRIAQVEMIAALAVLFQKYSVELAVDEWASDEEVAAMGAEERTRVYEKATEASRETIRQARSLLTLKLHGKQRVPVRLVRRGEERFLNVVGV